MPESQKVIESLYLFHVRDPMFVFNFSLWPKDSCRIQRKRIYLFFIKIDSPKFVCLIKHKICFHLRVFFRSTKKFKSNSTVQSHYEILNDTSASVSFAVSLLCAHQFNLNSNILLIQLATLSSSWPQTHIYFLHAIQGNFKICCT